MDADWIEYERACRGDNAAWTRLWERHRTRLSTLAVLLCGDAAAAADCVQQAFVRLAHSPPPHRAGTLGGYLSTIVYHAALREKQRRARLAELSRVETAPYPSDPLGDLIHAEEQRRVAAAIGALDEPHRTTLVLRFYAGYSYDEIAAATGVPLGTVKSRLFYAVKACRDVLSDQGESL